LDRQCGDKHISTAPGGAQSVAAGLGGPFNQASESLVSTASCFSITKKILQK
jgi:hypothetical protein